MVLFVLNSDNAVESSENEISEENYSTFLIKLGQTLFLGQKVVGEKISSWNNLMGKKVTTLSAAEGKLSFCLFFPCHLISFSNCVLIWI